MSRGITNKKARSNDLLDKLPTPGSTPKLEIESVKIARDDNYTSYRVTDYRTIAAYEAYGDIYPSLTLDRKGPTLISHDRKELQAICERMKTRPVYILDPDRARYAPDVVDGLPYVSKPRFGSSGPTVRLYVVPSEQQYNELTDAINQRFRADEKDLDWLQGKLKSGVLNSTRCQELFACDLTDFGFQMRTGAVTKAMIDKVFTLEQPAHEAQLTQLDAMLKDGRLTKKNCGLDPNDENALGVLTQHDANQLRKFGNTMATHSQRTRLLAYDEGGICPLKDDERQAIANETIAKRDVEAIINFRAIGSTYDTEDVGMTGEDGSEKKTDNFEAFDQLARTGFYEKPQNRQERDHNALRALQGNIDKLAKSYANQRFQQLLSEAKERGENVESPTLRDKFRDEAKKAAKFDVEYVTLPVDRRLVLHTVAAERPYILGVDRSGGAFIVNTREAQMDQYSRERTFQEESLPFLRIERATKQGGKSYIGALDAHTMAHAELEAEAIGALHQHRWNIGLGEDTVHVGIVHEGEIIARDGNTSVVFDGDHTMGFVPNTRLPADAALFDRVRVTDNSEGNVNAVAQGRGGR